ncbi:MAG: pyridoxamine 5'-phosphate oxidase family protein [Chlamydiales bacterium]|nr:pyridoxamine 5'-phosphate oxidase family protein [Chlamydiales bacterium]
MIIPTEIDQRLRRNFGYPARIIAQVATLSKIGPDLRSMGLYEVDTEGGLIFLSNRNSSKWKELVSQPTISALMLSSNLENQIIARGEAQLLTSTTNPDLIEKFWKQTPPQAKLTYLNKNEDHYVPLTEVEPPEHAPENFGIIRIIPNMWELLDVDFEHYHSSLRMIYTLQSDGWKATRINAM